MVQSLMMTNREFADRIGVHFTMASRLRSGSRLPSTATLDRIRREFDLPADELLDAHQRGVKAFGAYLREHLPIEDEVSVEVA